MAFETALGAVTFVIAAALKAVVRKRAVSIDVPNSRSSYVVQWSAPLSVDEALARTVAWYVREGR